MTRTSTKTGNMNMNSLRRSAVADIFIGEWRRRECVVLSCCSHQLGVSALTLAVEGARQFLQ